MSGKGDILADEELKDEMERRKEGDVSVRECGGVR
jgi:hypothetical protein